ncbi:MAG: hypothetical protein M3340_01655 [Actinomycetota bacterium]|nr:hypothetical protein [Actinomycetota bacterium]
MKLITEPGFEGRDSAAAILAIALDLFKETEYTHDLGDEHSHVLVGDARVLGKQVKVTWLLEFDAEGKIRELWLMARPLAGLIAVTLAVGQAAERAEQGPALRELSEPLVDLAADLEPAAARMVGDLNRSTANRSTD